MELYGRFLNINGVDYPATFFGRIKDVEWENRRTKTIRVAMSYEEAVSLFVDNVSWAIKEVTPGIPTEEDPEPAPVVTIYDNSEYCMSGDIVDFRNGYLDVKMGVLTDMESLIQDIYGQVNSDEVGPIQTLDSTAGLSPRAQAFYNLYARGMISIGAIRQAVMDGVLTQEEYEIITGQPYEA